MNYPNAQRGIRNTRSGSRKIGGRYAVMVFSAVFVLVSGGFDRANAMRVPPSAGESAWFIDMNRFARSAHAGFTCVECHGTMMTADRQHPDEKRADFLKRSATRTYDYDRCRKCHERSFKRYQAGGHAKARQEEKNKPQVAKTDSLEKRTAPTCGACHASHYVRSGQSRVDVGRRMMDVCGGCHPAHTESYRDNIHGRTGVDLGNPKAAFCTDCHGAHTVDSLKKQETALTVCRRCHHEAETKFTDIVIHASLASMASVSGADAPKKRSVVWIDRVRWAAIAGVALSLAFFVVHSFLWLLREIHEKLRKH